jgi:uncharacterized protein (DUF885 family)
VFEFSLSRREALGTIAAASALPAVSAFAAPAAEAQAKTLLDSFAEHMLDLFPESATSMGLDTRRRDPLRSRLSDRSASGQQRVRQTIAADLQRAEQLDLSTLSFATRTSVEVVKSAYRTALEGFAFPYGDVAVGGYRNTPYVVIQNVGTYIDTPQLLETDQPIESAADAEAYLSRLAQYPKQLDGETGRLRAAREQGLVPPKFLLDKAIGQLMISGKNAFDGGTFVQSLVRRTREKNIPGDWEARARKIVTGDVSKALGRQIGELQMERNLATEIPGMWSRPQGDEYYRWALKASTTTSLSPDEIHQMGLERLKDLHERMEPILKSLGYTWGSIGDRMKALAKDPRYKFAEGDEGRAEIVAYIQQQLAKIRTLLPRGFKKLVNPPVTVVRMSPEQEPGAPAAYGASPSVDGRIPGKFWINFRSTDLHSKYSLPDLAAHEAIPGHIWQGEFANRMPLIRTLLAFNAYTEGWALYAEQLVDELGLYDDFPVGRLGYLQSIAFRCCRLVVDTGLHAKRWTRQQAVDFFVNVNGSNPLEVDSEVDRYCAWPGQACGYEVGHSTIDRLRDKAKRALGPRFDLRTFDDAVLLGGNVPMDVLAKNVGEYIARSKAGA